MVPSVEWRTVDISEQAVSAQRAPRHLDSPDAVS